MRPYLHPCSACARHILSSERECPFCGSVSEAAPPPKQQKPHGRISRAALVALSTVAVPAGACNATPVYGAPAGDGEMSGDGDGEMSGDGDGNISGAGGSPQLVYGAPPTGGKSGATGGAPSTGGAPATGGTQNEGGMGGAPEGSGGADEMGAGGEQLVPIYGLAPRPFK